MSGIAGGQQENVDEKIDITNSILSSISDKQLPDNHQVEVSNTDLATSANQINGTQRTRVTDQYGFIEELTPMGEMRVVNPVRLVGATFPNGGNAGAVDTNFWTATVANNGTIVQANNQVTLSSSTTNNGSAILQSTRRARYIGGSANRYRAQVQLGDTGVSSNTRRWGMFDGTDGAYFELAGTTLSACVIKTGSRTAVDTLTAPTTNVTTYEIYITNSKVYFVISDILVATHSATTATWADNFNLPVRTDNINSGSTTNSTIQVRVSTIYRLGGLQTNPTFFRGTTAATTVLKYGAGVLHHITLNNPVGTLITVYDDTAGTSNIIAIVSTPAQANPVTLTYNVPFNNGLKVVTTGTWDYTIVYE